MYIYSEDEFDIEVPICVYPVVNHLSYDPFIDFGFLKVGQPKEHIIRIENKGAKVAEIKL